MLYRSGILLGFFAVFLQIAVFLQSLLPEQYQISPVCETITRALLSNPESNTTHSHSHTNHDLQNHHEHGGSSHDANHQCQYCTVYANVVLPPELGIREVLERIQLRLLVFKRTFSHVYFALQRLFLLPQGRAPPVFA